MHHPYFHISFSKKYQCPQNFFLYRFTYSIFCGQPLQMNSLIFLARFPWVANFIFHLFVYRVVALTITFVHGTWRWTPSLPFSLTPYYTFICYNGILSIMYLHRAFVTEIGGICTSPMNIWDMLIEQIIWLYWINSFLY
jgi:hypothetical protein